MLNKLNKTWVAKTMLEALKISVLCKYYQLLSNIILQKNYSKGFLKSSQKVIMPTRRGRVSKKFPGRLRQSGIHFDPGKESSSNPYLSREHVMLVFGGVPFNCYIKRGYCCTSPTVHIFMCEPLQYQFPSFPDQLAPSARPVKS